MKISLEVDSILYEYLTTKYSEKKLNEVLTNQLKKAVRFEGRCPVCNTGVFNIVPQNNFFLICSNENCKATGVVLPHDIVLNTDDLGVYKIKTFRIAVAKNKRGAGKIYMYLKKAKKNKRELEYSVGQC